MHVLRDIAIVAGAVALVIGIIEIVLALRPRSDAQHRT